MPKIVDHDARREEIVDAVWRLVARDGIASATTRNIADEAGCSNGVLSHYFADKAQLLSAALLAGYRRTEKRVNEALRRAHGLEALREVLLLTIPIDGERRIANQVELAFWGHAVGDRKLARQHYETYGRFRDIVRRLLVDARRAGEVRADVDVEIVAETLVALIDGLGTEVSLFPDAFSPERQRAVVDGALAGLAPANAARRARPTRSRTGSAAAKIRKSRRP
jgi:AcrR family transcriptional regulator